MLDFLKKFNWSVISIVWLAVIFFLLLFDGRNLDVEQPKFFLHADKVVHAGIFWIWAFCLSFASIQRHQYIRYIAILIAIIFVAVSSELIQGMTSYRTADPIDSLADVIGGIIAIIFCSIVLEKEPL